MKTSIMTTSEDGLVPNTVPPPERVRGFGEPGPGGRRTRGAAIRNAFDPPRRPGAERGTGRRLPSIPLVSILPGSSRSSLTVRSWVPSTGPCIDHRLSFGSAVASLQLRRPSGSLVRLIPCPYPPPFQRGVLAHGSGVWRTAPMSSPSRLFDGADDCGYRVTGQRKSAAAFRVTVTSPASCAANTASSEVSRYGVTFVVKETENTSHAPPW